MLPYAGEAILAILFGTEALGRATLVMETVSIHAGRSVPCMNLDFRITAPRPSAYVLVGLPGSGKSTWALKHPRQLPIASTDHFIEDYAARKNLSYAQAFQEFYPTSCRLMKDRVDQFIREKQSFIWDQINLNKKERQGIYDLLHPTHDVVFVCVMTPLETCLTRHAQRLRDAKGVIDEKRIRLIARNASFPDAFERHEGIIVVGKNCGPLP